MPPRLRNGAPRRPRMPQDGPIGFQEAQRAPQEASQDGSKRLNSIDYQCVVPCVSRPRPFELPTLQDGPRCSEGRPKTAQEAP
eukprot:2200014-Pyramimonas_sp.AAC.1